MLRDIQRFSNNLQFTCLSNSNAVLPLLSTTNCYDNNLEFLTWKGGKISDQPCCQMYNEFSKVSKFYNR